MKPIHTICTLPGGILHVVTPNKRGYTKALVCVNAKAINYTN